MPESVKLEKAELRQLDAEFKNEIESANWTKVQFNPESLKVSFANQIETPQGAGDQSGSPPRQFVGAGTTKLSLQLWFDITQPAPEGLPEENDVRKLTQRVAYFITPKEEGGKFVPPAVRFIWGSFQFDGLMESLEENLEFFSPEGRPLRASMTVNLTQQKITKFTIKDPKNAPAGGATPGTRPLTEAPANKSLQSLADGQGKGGDWQSIAAANNIENPRLLRPGQLIDMNATLPKVSAGASASVGAGVSGSAAGAAAGANVAGGAAASVTGAGASINAGGLIR
ncbi:MAG: LysM peptidoglycan-binding domain-containing protein [Acidobacteria bacterium]|nr:LysM peptidoglycan-binding domain-containing protein [Acidobacteriota bacterium]